MNKKKQCLSCSSGAKADKEVNAVSWSQRGQRCPQQRQPWKRKKERVGEKKETEKRGTGREMLSRCRTRESGDDKICIHRPHHSGADNCGCHCELLLHGTDLYDYSTRCVWVLSCFSHIQLFATLRTIARQTPLSIGFCRQEYWSGVPFPSPGDLPNPRIEPTSLVSSALTSRFFTTSTTWEGMQLSSGLIFSAEMENLCFVHINGKQSLEVFIAL